MPLPYNRRLGAGLMSFVALALLLAFAAAAPTARARGHARTSCPGANASPRHASHVLIKRAVACLIDRQRIARGLPPLRESSDLDLSAQRASNWMVRSGDFDHGRWTARMSNAGFAYSMAGEDIGTGYGTAGQIVAGWLASTGHCRVMLDPRFSRVGTGVVAHSVPGYSNGGATWAADFGLPRDDHAPSGNLGPADGCPYR